MSPEPKARQRSISRSRRPKHMYNDLIMNTAVSMSSLAQFVLTAFDWYNLRPESIFGGQVLERTPAGLTIVYIVGVGILLGFLVLTFYDSFNRPKFLSERDLPREVKKRLTQTIANRSIRVWQMVFVVLAFSVFGFQVYWTYFADESNQQFQALAYKDMRTRRTTAAN